MLALCLTLGFSACNNNTSKNTAPASNTAPAAVYTCSMHPEVQSDKPGDCPTCGMALIKQESPDSTQLQAPADTGRLN